MQIKPCSISGILIVSASKHADGRGFFSENDARRVNERLAALLREDGIEILAWYVCPHAPGTVCDCRKPAPGMALAAARDWGLALAGSYVVGVGNDWDGAVPRGVPAGQAMVHQWPDVGVGDTFWVQRGVVSAQGQGEQLSLGDSAPVDHQWNLAAVEILPPASLSTG